VIGRRVIQLRQPPQPPSAAAASPAASPSPSSSCFWRLASRPPAGADPAAELADAERALLDYLNVGPGRPRLAELARGWAAADARYRSVAAALPGARMLRQAPLECLFSFVCSSNNHISRIHGMVERLCSAYGSRLELEPWAARELAALAKRGAVVPATPATLGSGGGGGGEDGDEEQDEEEGDAVIQVEVVVVGAGARTPAGNKAAAAAGRGGDGGGAVAPAFWAFPTLEQLAAASDEALRADGFGCVRPCVSDVFISYTRRAHTLKPPPPPPPPPKHTPPNRDPGRFIAGSVALLRAKAAAAKEGAPPAPAPAAAAAAASDDNGDEWLMSLRSPDVPLERAVELLTELPGVGPKVASCVALFSLDKHGAVPVDTHVWDLAKKYYARDALRGKAAPQAALHPIVQKAFTDAFGPYAGWAHNALFVGELPAFQGRVRRAARGAAGGGKGAGAGASGGDSSSDEEDGDDDDKDDGDFELRTPAKLGSGKRGGKRAAAAPSPASVAREERRRRRTWGGGDDEGQQAPTRLQFESVLS